MEIFGKTGVILDRLETTRNMRHSNGEITKIYVGRIHRYIQGEKINFDDADYIVFEVSYDMREINDEVKQAVINQFKLESKGKLSAQNIYYIGKIERTRTGYRPTTKSSTVEQLIRNEIKKEINREKEEQHRRIQESRRESQIRNAQVQREREFRDQIDARDYLEGIKAVQRARINSPTLRKVMSMNNSRYENYNGVDMTTGDILRIRNVDKVGKDGSGTYLYSAFLDTVPKEDANESLTGNSPMGRAVCFELQKRLEDIVREKKPEEVRGVLQLLSEGLYMSKPRQLTYVGEINKEGQIIHGKVSTSLAIRREIERMKRSYAETYARDTQDYQTY